MSHRLHKSIVAVVFLLLLPPLFSQSSNDPKISDIDVKIDDIYIKKVEGTKVGALFASQLEESENPMCRAAAVLVSQEAVDKYGYWSTLVDLLKETAQGVKLGADLAGAKSVSKVAQLAGTIAECFEQEEPEAALGRAVVSEASDWLSGKIPKTDEKPVDDAIKRQADQAKTKLIDALFPGKTRKASTYHATVGDCTVDVTPEFQWPGPGKTGGIRLFVSGDCGCKKPLKLNSGLFPTTFHGQPDEIKNSQLGRFALIVFLPMERMETSVSYGGKAIDLAKYLKTGSKLKTAIEGALSGKESKEDPGEIAKDLQEQTGKITDLKATVLLRPVFAAQLKLEELKVLDCGNCPQAPAPPAPVETFEKPINVNEKNCDKRCQGLRDDWRKVLQEEVDARHPGPNSQGLEKAIAILEKEIATVQTELNSAQGKLNDLRGRLAEANKNVKYHEDRAKQGGFEPSSLGDLWTKAQAAQESANAEVKAQEGVVERASKKLADLQKDARNYQTKLGEMELKSAAAEAAYYNCASCCWKDARQNPNVKVPDDVLAWEKAHPLEQCLVGTWRSQSVEGAIWPGTTVTRKRGGSGIIVTVEECGKIRINYNSAGKIEQFNPVGQVIDTSSYTGTATGYVTSKDGELIITSSAIGEISGTMTTKYGTKTGPLSGLGPVFVGGGKAPSPYKLNYTCNETTLVIKATVRGEAMETTTFQRQQK